MDFSLSPEQSLLRDTARRLASDHVPAAVLRDHMDDRAVATRLDDRLREYAALGDADTTDLALFLEELGAVAAPGAFFATTALFAPLVRSVDADLHAAVVDGELTGTVALARCDGEWIANDEAVKAFVPDADLAERIAVVSTDGVCVVAGAPLRPVATLDTTRRFFEVDARGLPATPLPVDPAVVTGVVERATVLLAAEMVGTARRLLEMALAYAKERVQFDVPIGSFQAVQHKLADVSLTVERARAAVQYAAMCIDAVVPERHRAAHVAKAAAGAAATRAAKDAIQVHGGIGYTWEHDLHLYMRRAFTSEYWMGTSDRHHDRLAALLFA
ncbi:MAG: acyl-CoA dehydrogenase family protein [Acidimicrobiia bacterium]